MEDIISMYTPARFPGFDMALNVVIRIAVMVGFLVIFQSMYTAVLERTREIGILKSMGASKLTVGVVLRECAVLAVAGVMVGIAVTFGVRAMLRVRFPGFAFELTGAWIGYGALIAFAARSAERFIRPGWRRAKTPSTPWPTNRPNRRGVSAAALNRSEARFQPPREAAAAGFWSGGRLQRS